MGSRVPVGLIAAGLALAGCASGEDSVETTASVAVATTTMALITTTTTTPPETTTTTADGDVAEWCRIGEEVNTQAQSGSLQRAICWTIG